MFKRMLRSTGSSIGNILKNLILLIFNIAIILGIIIGVLHGVFNFIPKEGYISFTSDDVQQIYMEGAIKVEGFFSGMGFEFQSRNESVHLDLSSFDQELINEDYTSRSWKWINKMTVIIDGTPYLLPSTSPGQFKFKFKDQKSEDSDWGEIYFLPYSSENVPTLSSIAVSQVSMAEMSTDSNSILEDIYLEGSSPSVFFDLSKRMKDENNTINETNYIKMEYSSNMTCSVMVDFENHEYINIDNKEVLIVGNNEFFSASIDKIEDSEEGITVMLPFQEFDDDGYLGDSLPLSDINFKISCTNSGTIIQRSSGKLNFQISSNSKKEYDVLNQIIYMQNIETADKALWEEYFQSNNIEINDPNTHDSMLNVEIICTDGKPMIHIDGRAKKANISGYSLFPNFWGWYAENITLIPFSITSAVFAGVGLLMKDKKKTEKQKETV